MLVSSKFPNMKLEVLLIEDDPADAVLARDEITNSIIGNFNIRTLHDGEAALQYLTTGYKITDNTKPNLVLLDLDLPGKSGFEILTKIRESSELESTVVVILTGNKDDRSALRAWGKNADGYLKKPLKAQELMDVLKTI